MTTQFFPLTVRMREGYGRRPTHARLSALRTCAASTSAHAHGQGGSWALTELAKAGGAAPQLKGVGHLVCDGA